MKHFDIINIILWALVLLVLSFSLGRSLRAEPVAEESVPVVTEIADTLDIWQQLIMAIAFTESQFTTDALGTAGDTGILQLQEIYVKEVNRLYGTEYTIQDAYDPEKSLKIFSLMQGHYNPNKDLAIGIKYHNKSAFYATTVKQNMALIQRYEKFRKLLINTKL
jgi:hypothetical protein